MKPISESDLEQLSAYIDGELSDSERRFFQKRLAADAGLRAACERAWIASAVLRSQPIRLMPAGSAEAICTGCPDKAPSAVRWRIAASFAAAVVAVGLGLQWWPSGQSQTAAPRLVVAPIAPQTAVPAPVVHTQPAAATARVATVSKPPASVQARVAALPAADTGNPSQFALNEAVLAKSWPKRDAAMQDYLVRHNRMAGNAAGNDLISYAELLAEPQNGPQTEPQNEPTAPEQE